MPAPSTLALSTHHGLSVSSPHCPRCCPRAVGCCPRTVWAVWAMLRALPESSALPASAQPLFLPGPQRQDWGKLRHRPQCDNRGWRGGGGWGAHQALHCAGGGPHSLPLLAGVLHHRLELLCGAMGEGRGCSCGRLGLSSSAPAASGYGWRDALVPVSRGRSVALRPEPGQA